MKIKRILLYKILNIIIKPEMDWTLKKILKALKKEGIEVIE